MKRLFKTCLILLLSFSTEVVLADSCIDGFHNNYVAEPKYDGKKSYDTGDLDFLTYDITNVRVVDNMLYIHGWAFDHTINNDLGGKATQKTSDNVTVRLALAPNTKEEAAKASSYPAGYIAADNIEYAVPDNGKCSIKGCSDEKPKFYDLTYWNCYRSGGADRCGPNGNTLYAYGGFVAKFDLNKLDENKTYTLKINLLGTSVSNKLKVLWKPVGAHDSALDNTVKVFNDSNDNGFNISTNFAKSFKVGASLGTSKGKLGTYCSADTGGVHVSLNRETQTYHFASGNPILSCVGGTGVNQYTAVDNNGYNRTNYKNCFSYDNTQATPGPSTLKLYPVQFSNGVGYVPGSWIKYTSYLTVKSGDKIQAETCDGKEVYNFYYLFLESVPISNPNSPLILGEKKDGFRTTSTTEIYPDRQILKNLNFNSNKEIISAIKTDPGTRGSVIKLVSTNEFNAAKDKLSVMDISKFYTIYNTLRNNSTQDYYQEGNNYYMWHSGGYCVGDTCYKGKNDYQDPTKLLQASFSTDSDKDREEGLKNGVKIEDFTNSLGFNFSITRYNNRTSINKRYSINGSKIVLYDGRAYQPALYLVSFCKSDEEIKDECADDTLMATCTEGNVTGRLHENNKLKTCTLAKNNSGFSLVSADETSEYCSVSCKDDFDLFMPGSKSTKAGGYFTLDNYIPEIKAKRTCVSSKINYDKFNDDMAYYENKMEENYRLWKDWEKIYSKVRSTFTNPTYTSTRKCYEKKNIVYDDDGNEIEWEEVEVGEYTVNHWRIDSIQIGSAHYDGASGEYYSGCDGTVSDTSSSALNEISSKVSYYKKLYEDFETKYKNIQAGYKKCYEWTKGNEFKFSPKVTFDYEDQDKSAFGSQNFSDTITSESSSIQYWGLGTEVNEDYTTSGSTSTPTSITRKTMVCSGDSCTRSKDESFYTNSYIKRTETSEHRYNLPRLVSLIPSGKVTLGNSSSSDRILLPAEAVPVNINTLAGNHNYYVNISGIVDATRKAKKPDNPEDDLEERFKTTAVNSNGAYTCNYRVTNDIYVKGKLNYFYRTIDPYDINPNSRDLGYNWTGKKADTVKNNLKEDAQDYQVLTNSKDRDKFSFTLTPAMMKEIRSYNARRTNDGGYSDFELVCKDYGVSGGYHCYSNFLTCLASGGGNQEKGSKVTCNQIFGNTLNNYSSLTKYNDVDLDANRKILIDKQNTLDGRKS